MGIMGSLVRKFLSDQTIYWLKLDWHFLLLRLRLQNLNRIKPNAKFLNVGCGPQGLESEDWFNLDGFPKPGLDLAWDATRCLPFPEPRFQGIYAEHFFEHLEPHQAKHFLSECRRSLVPGGILRLSVPDGELYLKRYFEDREWMLARRNRRFQTPMEVINEVFRQGREHHYCFDYETLSLWLRNAGFVEVVRADLGLGACPELLIDQEWRKFESLYVEARCP